MKNHLSVLLICFYFLLSSFTIGEGNKHTQTDIIIENQQFTLIVGSDAITISLTLKSTGEECLMQGEGIALFSVTQERPYHNEIKLGHPNKKTTFQANSIQREGDRLIVGFELIPYKAVILIKERPGYIDFSLDHFIADNIYPSYLKITPPPATEICLLQLPIRQRENFGEWLNVCWDHAGAVNVLASNEYTYIDHEKRNGYYILRGSAIKNIQFKGIGASLIASDIDKLLDNIAQLEEDFDLPQGVSSRRNPMINASYYWVSNINPTNVDEHISYAKQGGFRTMNIYYPSFETGEGYSSIGNYEINRDLYPKGKEDLRKMLDKIKAAGIIPGVHFLHSHIGRKSQYVTPIPDYRLNQTRLFNLSKDLGIDDTTIYVEQNPEETVMADDRRVLKVGTELIAYENYTTTPPYRFTGCVRGIDNTTINAAPKGFSLGVLDVSEFGATSIYIDQRTSLQDEVAEKIADLYDAGFQFIYFDGSEGVNPPFNINVSLAQYRVFKRLKPAPLFAEGAAKTHFGWHMLSGGNAFDVFRPEELKEQTRKWPAEEAPRMKQDFTRINFGWLGYWVPSETTIGTQPDMLEYVTSLAASWDCPISIQVNLDAFKAHPRTADNLEVIRRWEEVRAENWLTEEQKKSLQQTNQEHHLLVNENNEPELVAYDSIDDFAGGNKDIRAFIFERKGSPYVVYWHISGDKKLELPLNSSDIRLYETLGKEETVDTSSTHRIIIPASSRRYIQGTNLSKQALLDACRNARILE